MTREFFVSFLLFAMVTDWTISVSLVVGILITSYEESRRR